MPLFPARSSYYIKSAHRLFHSTPSIRQNYFDTFKLVERLEREGFTREQSEAIMRSLQKVISTNMNELNKLMVSKADREKVQDTINIEICSSHFITRPFMNIK